MSVPLSLAVASLLAGAPIGLAAVGGLFTEAAGSLSVALEGCMTVGAFTAAAVARQAGIAGLGAPEAAMAGLLAGLLAGLFLALLVGLAAERFGADVFVAGLAANLLAPGIASLVSMSLFGTKGVVQAAVLVGTEAAARGTLTAVPGTFGPSLAQTLLPLAGPGFLLPIFASLILAVLLSTTILGLRMRAAGDPGEAAVAAGLDRAGLRILAHLVAGGAAGLAGAILAQGVSAWVPGMASGRGWIALVAIYLGGRRAWGVLLASLGFGFLIALSNAAQAFAGLPAELILALPYLVTGIALVVGRWAGRSTEKGRIRTG